MLNRIFKGASLSASEAMLTFAANRQKVIAANIANVDTAGYKTQDLSEADFKRQLDNLFSSKGKPVVIRSGPADDAGPLKENGNNVDLEIEMAKMVRNSALHSTAAALLAQQFTLLREAIAGRVL
jgi:flagellar basal-body rod protein FlgB